MKAHLIKFTTAGIVCCADACMEREVEWNLTYQGFVAAGAHSYLAHVEMAAEHTGGRECLAESYRAAAQMLKWAGVSMGDVRPHGKLSGVSLSRAMEEIE